MLLCLLALRFSLPLYLKAFPDKLKILADFETQSQAYIRVYLKMKNNVDSPGKICTYITALISHS